ncbi:hypothetical protein H0H81_005035 [Sphagnurus paluster]|uniref:Uncharacterized protein n=1 Tax=Sphagnurus paluster TaxID=117069 RepID=A0A9P7GGM7_9AGAR|nr:hypothetical protein H0H81_005035 [Sphagnurus paluster]
MAERVHKRKRSLAETPVDISKLRAAQNRLASLKEEVGDIEETKDEMAKVMEHIRALEVILGNVKKPRVTFSTVKLEDLKTVGVERKRLIFDDSMVMSLMDSITTEVDAEVKDLHSRVQKIYKHVNMDFEPGSRMILDAVLLALTEIASIQQGVERREVAILPEMRIAPGEGVRVVNPVSGYEIWLSGNVDYAVIAYDDVKDNKGEPHPNLTLAHLTIMFLARLLRPGGSRQDALLIARGQLFLVEAKRQGERDLSSYTPDAVSQAIALLKSANLEEARFCLSDGETWIFFILKSENGKLTYYESAPRLLNRYLLEHSDMSLREIVQLVCEWLRPTQADLFALDG